MPSGGSGNYPGVDPDGRQPGGLEIAGNIEAGSYTVGGAALPTSPVGAKTVIKKTIAEDILTGAFADIAFDVIVDDPDGYADLANNGITVTAPGLYLIQLQSNVSSGLASSGSFIVAPDSLTSMTIFPNLQATISRVHTPPETYLWVAYLAPTIPNAILFGINNNTDATINVIDASLALVRIA